jgi:ATP-binding cassette, subfamily B, bacterial
MHQYRTLIGFARRQHRSFLLIAALTLAAALFAACQPWPLKLVVDHVLGKLPVPPALDQVLLRLGLTPSAPVLLVIATGGGLILFALNSAVEIILATRWTAAGRRMVYDLSEELFGRLQRRSILFHRHGSVGDAMSRVTEDSWCLYRVLDTLILAPAQALLTMGLMFVLMAQLDLLLAVLAAAVAPCMVAASFLVGRPLHAAARLKREIESRIQSHLQQTLTGLPLVQAFVQEGREGDRFRQFAEAAIRIQQYSTLLGSVNSLSSGLVTALGTGVILWVGAQRVLEGRLSLGSLLVFIVYLTSLQAQVKVLSRLHTALRGFQASLDRVMEVLEAPPEVAERPGAAPLSPVRGRVQFENVVFGYEPGRPVLRGLSLEARPGQTVAIVGETGAGKTTLVQLLPRFFDPWAGRVRIDGTDVREVQLESLRRQMSIVFQEPFLFPTTVAENIAYGRPQATAAEIEAAARAANAHHFIEKLPGGYATVLDERGGTLSQGERQRLAVARALLRNAPLLILDEPTSAVDPGTEGLLLEALERLMAGRTTLVIAHRLSTVRRADRIVVLKDGVVTEDGTHAELLAHGGLYARWSRLQSGSDGRASPWAKG